MFSVDISPPVVAGRKGYEITARMFFGEFTEDKDEFLSFKIKMASLVKCRAKCIFGQN
jgi:hypothetical protein